MRARIFSPHDTCFVSAAFSSSGLTDSSSSGGEWLLCRSNSAWKSLSLYRRSSPIGLTFWLLGSSRSCLVKDSSERICKQRKHCCVYGIQSGSNAVMTQVCGVTQRVLAIKLSKENWIPIVTNRCADFLKQQHERKIDTLNATKNWITVVLKVELTRLWKAPLYIVHLKRILSTLDIRKQATTYNFIRYNELLQVINMSFLKVQSAINACWRATARPIDIEYISMGRTALASWFAYKRQQRTAKKLTAKPAVNCCMKSHHRYGYWCK